MNEDVLDLWLDGDGVGRFLLVLVVLTDFIASFCFTRVTVLLWLSLHF